MSSPTLSGAQAGEVRPVREVEKGIWIYEGDRLVNKPCWLRVVRERDGSACLDYARQLLTARGDGKYTPQQLQRWTNFFLLHFAMIEPPQDGAPLVQMYPLPAGVSDKNGKLDLASVWTLQLHNLADGQGGRLADEYDLLLQTQTPAALTHAEWEALITEGKEQSLMTLVSLRGCSALIQLLSGIQKGQRT